MPAAVRRGDRVGLLPAERVELGRLELALLVVGLVDRDDHRRRRAGAAARPPPGRPASGRSTASTTKTITSASAIASRACSWTRASIGSSGSTSSPPVSTTTKRRPFHSASPYSRSRVVRARSSTIAVRVADDPVEERALADVRPADDGDDRERRRACVAAARLRRRRHAAPASVARARERGRAAGRRRGARRGRPRPARAACAAASGVPASSRIRSATSRRSSIGVEVPPVTPTISRAVERRRRRSGRGRPRSGSRGVPAISHEPRQLLGVGARAAADDDHQVDLAGRLERVLLAADRDRADRVDDLELVARARP